MTTIEMTLNRRHWLAGLRRRFFLRVPSAWQEVPAKRRAKWWRWQCDLPEEKALDAVLKDTLAPLPACVRKRIPVDTLASIRGLLAFTKPTANCEDLPLPDSKVARKTFLLPSPKGENMATIEFALGDDLYKEYCAGKNECLHMLTWLLYRELDTDEDAATARGDARIPLRSKAEIERRLKVYGVPPVEMQVQAVLFFSGLKKFLHGTFGNWIFEPTPDPEDEDEQPQSGDDLPNFGWWGTLQAVAETGAFGTLEQTYQASLYEVCVWLVRKRVEAIRMERAVQNTHKPSDSL